MRNYQYFDMAQKNYDFYTKYAIFEGKTERLSRTCNIIELGWYKNFIELNIFKKKEPPQQIWTPSFFDDAKKILQERMCLRKNWRAAKNWSRLENVERIYISGELRFLCEIDLPPIQIHALSWILNNFH